MFRAPAFDLIGIGMMGFGVLFGAALTLIF
jgi:hypothetical protein